MSRYPLRPVPPGYELVEASAPEGASGPAGRGGRRYQARRRDGTRTSRIYRERSQAVNWAWADLGEASVTGAVKKRRRAPVKE